MDNNLEDDVVEYKGGTLEIHSDDQKTVQLQQSTSGIQQDIESGATGTQSIITPITTFPKKITDRLWNKPKETNTSKSVLQVFQSPPESPSDFFTFRDGVIEKAVKECKDELLDPDVDGEFIAYFLLTEVTFWDTEKERLVLIATNTCSIIKYDFIALKRLECKKVFLKNVDSVVIGELVYPPASLVPERNLNGIRLMWNKGEPLTFTTKWNPFIKDLPFATFISHPLSCQINKEINNDIQQSNIFEIADFNETIVSAIHKTQRSENINHCLILHNNIVLQSYLGIGSLIHNRNALGFFKICVPGDMLAKYLQRCQCFSFSV